MAEILQLNGSFMEDDGYFQFNVDRVGLQEMADKIQAAIAANSGLDVLIADGILRFEIVERPIFEASAMANNTVYIKLWKSYLADLAIRLNQMINDNDPDHIGFVHAHLDNYFSKPGDGVLDLVIERIDALG